MSFTIDSLRVTIVSMIIERNKSSENLQFRIMQTNDRRAYSSILLPPLNSLIILHHCSFAVYVQSLAFLHLQLLLQN